MKIGIDGQNIITLQPAGPEIYNINLIKALAQLNTTDEFVIYLKQEPTTNFWQEISQNNKNFSYKVLQSNISWTQVALAKELLLNPVDAFFTSVHTMPLIRNPFLPVIGMIHGLEFNYNTSKNVLSTLLKGKHEWYVSQFSRQVIVPSQATKDAILKKWPWISSKKINIVYEGISPEYYPRTSEEIQHVRAKYKLDNDPYLFFISTIQPRKNIPGMIEGFAKFIKENPEFASAKLVIAGKKGWSFGESLDAPAKFNALESVYFVGRIPTQDAAALYSGANAFISCSFEEGFGLPLAEAMSCGSICVVSNIGAFKEVGDNVPFYIEPNSIQSISDGIKSVFSLSAEEAASKKAQAIQRAQSFSWNKTAQETLNIIKNV